MKLLAQPKCKTAQQTHEYLKEVEAMLALSFKEQPMQQQDPYATMGRLQLKVLEIGAAIASRECSTLKRKLHELAALACRANIETVDLETEDLL